MWTACWRRFPDLPLTPRPSFGKLRTGSLLQAGEGEFASVSYRFRYVQMNKVFRSLLLIVGTLSAVLGTLGIFVPILPTTPFLLLAAYCYARSSEHFYQRLLANRWFGEYIRNYREVGGVALG